MRLLKLLLCTRRKTQKMLQYVKMPACKSLLDFPRNNWQLYNQPSSTGAAPKLHPT